MNSKKRLFEVFTKVTGVPLNEQGMSQDQWDDFSDSVEYGIMNHFQRDHNLFNNGVPETIRETINDLGEIELKLIDDESIQHYKSFENQINYIANYKTTINNIPVLVRMPFVVSIEKNFAGSNIEFYTETFNSPDAIEVEVGE